MPVLLSGIALTLLFAWLSMLFDLHGAAGDVWRILRYAWVPRTLGALSSGITLRVSGYLIQETLYNTLASPNVMGINAGAELFTLLAALLFPAVTTAHFVLASLGALPSILLVLLTAKRADYSRSVIMLSGVVVSALMGAAMNGLVTFFPHAVADRQAFTLGGFAGLQYDGLFSSAAFILPGLLAGALFGGGIDLFALGDEVAQGLGLSVARHRLLTMMTVTMLAVTVICTGGLIGFLGLIVPNVLRCFFAGRMSAWQMFTLSRLYDGALLIATDFLARRLFYPYELLVGLLLNLLGAPFFIWIPIHRKHGI